MLYSVYIVDDEKLFVNELVNRTPWLENGFEVVGYSTNPKTALREVVAKKPDVVFCDLKMPVYDGVELIRLIKDSGMDTEFIMLSAHGEYKATREFFLMNGFDYILKPLERDDAALVLEKLSRRLAGKHHHTPTIQFVPSSSKGFDDLVEYVTANFNKKHTLKRLSREFNISQTYICNLFANHYSSTLTIFITNLRMREAGKLIIETDSPLKEISVHCGYPDYYYFCRVFKTHFGKAPSEYREANR